VSNKMDLSLLPSQARFQMEKLKWIRNNRIFIGVVSGLWIVGLIIVVAMNLLAKMQMNNAEKRFGVATRDLAGMAEGVINSQRLKYNAKLVGEVLGSRFEYGQAFKTVATLFPEGISLNSYELQDRGMFSIQGQAVGADIDKVEKIVEMIKSGQDERFKQINVKTLSLKNNIWIFAAEVTLK